MAALRTGEIASPAGVFDQQPRRPRLTDSSPAQPVRASWSAAEGPCERAWMESPVESSSSATASLPRPALQHAGGRFGIAADQFAHPLRRPGFRRRVDMKSPGRDGRSGNHRSAAAPP